MHSNTASSIGSRHTFGAFGPVYEVLKTVKHLEQDDCLMRVRVLESGEELDYRYSKIKDDPEAR
ncbi:MAG: DUF5397 family protein [Stagnimonas sp.]|nr:DUF5397 family protein [Stagnimonas sp.]